MDCKHKFKARYSEKWSHPLKDVLDSGNTLQDGKGYGWVDTYLQERTYICDVCVKCGKIVRPSNEK